MARCRPQDSDGNSYLRSHGARRTATLTRVSDTLSAGLLTILRYCTIPRVNITVFSTPMTLDLSKHCPRLRTDTVLYKYRKRCWHRYFVQYINNVENIMYDWYHYRHKNIFSKTSR